MAILLLPQARLSSVGVIVDSVAELAGEVARQASPGARLTIKTAVRLLSPTGRSARLAGGHQLACDGDIHGNEAYRLVYLPAFVVDGGAALETLLREAVPVVQWLIRQHRSGALIAASGAASLIIAEAGLLDHGQIAVPPVLVSFCRRRYPTIRIVSNDGLAEWNGVLTCAAPTSEWNLAMCAMEKIFSAFATQIVAQATGTPPDRHISALNGGDRLVNSAQLWLFHRYANEPRIRDLAQALSVSHATLIRRFERSLGMTPRDYVRLLRIEASQHLLQSTDSRIEEICARVGYSDVRAFRRQFQAHTGLSPSAYRLKYKLNATLAPQRTTLLQDSMDHSLAEKPVSAPTRRRRGALTTP